MKNFIKYRAFNFYIGIGLMMIGYFVTDMGTFRQVIYLGNERYIFGPIIIAFGIYIIYLELTRFRKDKK